MHDRQVFCILSIHLKNLSNSPYTMRFIFIFSFLVIVGSQSVTAQNSEQEIQSVIETLFDGMREADSSMVSSAFASDAIMQTISVNQEGEVVKNSGSLPQFLQTIATPRPQILDEKISSYTIHVDGGLASAWTPYKFYIGENFSHCGVNSFQLAKLNGEWKIIYIVDTRRRTDCVEQ